MHKATLSFSTHCLLQGRVVERGALLIEALWDPSCQDLHNQLGIRLRDSQRQVHRTRESAGSQMFSPGIHIYHSIHISAAKTSNLGGTCSEGEENLKP